MCPCVLSILKEGECCLMIKSNDPNVNELMETKGPYDSVVSMLESLGGCENIVSCVKKSARKSRMAQSLFVMRCRYGISQEELADQIGCSVDQISVIETACDDDITIAILFLYVVSLYEIVLEKDVE